MDTSRYPSPNPNMMRLEIARHVVERKREALGTQVIAGACYGSVAHHAAMEYSDVEVVVITVDGVEPLVEQFFDTGIMVDCYTVPGSKWLAAAQEPTEDWGIQADMYEHQLVLWDPEEFFPRLRATAAAIPQESFDRALKTNWWRAYEARNKMLNAQLVGDHPRMIYGGLDFAFVIAMHIALYERKPYESERTLWQDVTTRGYGMKELVDALSAGALSRVRQAMDNVWEQTRLWGAPEG